MTNAPESRKTHITRIVGTNRDGDRLDDIWVDVERMDVVRSAYQIPPDFQWQGLQRRLKWCDDPDGEDYSSTGTPSRITEIVKVCDPEGQDVDDPDEWVPVRVIKGMKSKGGGSESMGQGFEDRFAVSVTEDELTTARKVEVRKIVHYDTSIDGDAKAAFDASPERLEYVAQGEFYQKFDDTKDDSQHVDHEVITFLKQKGNSEQVSGLARQTKLLNEYLIDESQEADGSVIGVSGCNPPYRLDPYQNIVNVNFAPRVYVIIIARSDFAVSLRDDVEIVETRSGTGSNSLEPISGTLIECSASLNDDIAALIISNDAFQNIVAFVCPKTETVRTSWFDDYVRVEPWSPRGDFDGLPRAPFLWFVSPRFQEAPVKIVWKIRYAPHLSDPKPGQINRMVHLYPTLGASTWHETIVGIDVTSTVSGWSLGAYRLDKKGSGLDKNGEKATYSAPPEWLTSNVEKQTFLGTTGPFGLLGLPFSVDPPLIARDIPLV